ncbi:MAG: archaeosine biosynthesis radical SAM protein RaSEA [Candidatus Thermoplasmatota archaeon]|jgi:radical SAM enzyme (TIGR01210 family)|nr:archaeosine biosynthesis radical SAM protein RaSEA [Candidatus Thermoplasmatota archaeon]
MNKLEILCKNLKKDFSPKNLDSQKPARLWSEKDVLDDKIVDTFVIIFRTRGCSWAFESGCSMCGYFNDSLWKDVSEIDLLKQFENAMKNYSKQKFVKIFTSGSFLDDKEITPKVRKQILNKLSENASKISVESRPEFINDKTLKEIKSIMNLKNFEIGLGLETGNDFIRKNCLNKGFTFNDYKKAANKLKKYKIDLKTYILIKPPFLTEKESIDDAVKTVEKIKKITDSISFNPTNVQKNTVVEYLWKRKQYRPAWLFSIIEILKESKKIVNNMRIKCDIVGGGNPRGAHNCGSCDFNFLKAVSEFSLKQQETDIFNNLDCNCREKWLDQLDFENLGFGSLTNMYG